MIHMLCCCNLNILGLACKWRWIVPCPCWWTNKAFQWWLLYRAIQISWKWKRRIFILRMAWSWGCNCKHGVSINGNFWTEICLFLLSCLLSLCSFVSPACRKTELALSPLWILLLIQWREIQFWLVFCLHSEIYNLLKHVVLES